MENYLLSRNNVVLFKTNKLHLLFKIITVGFMLVCKIYSLYLCSLNPFLLFAGFIADGAMPLAKYEIETERIKWYLPVSYFKPGIKVVKCS